MEDLELAARFFGHPLGYYYDPIDFTLHIMVIVNGKRKENIIACTHDITRDMIDDPIYFEDVLKDHLIATIKEANNGRLQ